MFAQAHLLSCVEHDLQQGVGDTAGLQGKLTTPGLLLEVVTPFLNPGSSQSSAGGVRPRIELPGNLISISLTSFANVGTNLRGSRNLRPATT